MPRSKYICFISGCTQSAVIFDETYDHHYMAVQVTGGLGSIVGAGFVSLGVGEDGNVKATVYGKSVSLKTESRESDIIPVQWVLGIYHV